MHDLRQKYVAFFAVPLYVVIILGEIIWSRFHNKKFYSVKETFMNFYIMGLTLLLDTVVVLLCYLILDFFYGLHLFEIKNLYLYWFLLLIGEDFFYYWQHRADHSVRFFWAVHVTHHSSQEFNFTTGFRSSVFQPFYRYVFFIPLALMGFKSMDIMLMYSITQIYSNLVHTQSVRKMGVLEYFMVTDSHHRVHHASNVRYLDRNMGTVFILWDKWFGSFQAEDDKDPVVYGLTKNVETPNHPVNIVTHEWKNILKDLKKSKFLSDKLRYLLMPPGWSHDGSTKTANELRKILFANERKST